MEPLPAPQAHGAEQVTFTVRLNQGHDAKPLAKTASGGELSRLMLALKVVLAGHDDVPTLIFDEVDAGIGGEIGTQVGDALGQVAAKRQVLVVTHLPQIACFADRHISVAKRDGVATLAVLEDDERIAELSRMLAGMAESAGAVSHAAELLDEAAKVKASA